MKYCRFRLADLVWFAIVVAILCAWFVDIRATTGYPLTRGHASVMMELFHTHELTDKGLTDEQLK